MISKKAITLFQQSIKDYHVTDDVNAALKNPFGQETSIDFLLYKKNWIDTVQWHLEDIIRDENINPEEALKIKRRIDQSNQERTDLVELIDTYFLEKNAMVQVLPRATYNTESPAWAVDRLSILELKIYHMQQESERESATDEHRAKCKTKLNILLQQREDLSVAIDALLQDIEQGLKYMKVYKQMKMYNDKSLNPILYKKELP